MDLEIQILQILQTFLQEVSIIFTATHMRTHTNWDKSNKNTTLSLIFYLSK